MNTFDKQRWAIYSELMQIGLEQQECWAEADLILEHVTGLKRTAQITSDIDQFKADWLQEISRIITLRRQRTPLAYCIGEAEFAGLMFRIVPGVLIPRVDTEILVETVVTMLADSGHGMRFPLYIAEIGVGSGAIVVSLLKRLPECHAWGCDISDTAIALTLGNARRHNVQERLTLVHGDWKKVLPNDFDIIVSNPPYLPLPSPTEEKSDLQPELAFEPKTALFDGSNDGLSFYKQFAEKLPAHFRTENPTQSPFVALEIGDNQSNNILDIFKKQDWKNLEIIDDVNGLARLLLASPVS
jgi:release factor glutamine methyltransferase